MLQSNDNEILLLLNQKASDMIKRSDVDEIVKNAVAEEHDRMVNFYEEKMKKMAAEYEAIIASLKKKDKGDKKGGNGHAVHHHNRQFHAASISETTIIHIKYL